MSGWTDSKNHFIASCIPVWDKLCYKILLWHKHFQQSLIKIKHQNDFNRQIVSQINIDLTVTLFRNLHVLDLLFHPDCFSHCYMFSRCSVNGIGLPIVVSYPHFFMADKEYQDAIDGLNPALPNLSTDIDIEPVTYMC